MKKNLKINNTDFNLKIRATLIIILFLLTNSFCKKKDVGIAKTPIKEDIPVVKDTIKNTTSLVYLNSQNKLAYNLFNNEGETEKLNRLPDFSNAGYKGGGVSLPNVSVKKTLTPLAGNNQSRIQQAINEVAALSPDANGFRGAILLKAGLYEVDGPLTIEASGVVLRGEGQGMNGTILKDIKKEQHNFIQVKGTGSGLREASGSRKRITDAYVPTGVKSFNLESSSGFAIGDKIAVIRTPNDTWINLIDMGQYGWTANSYHIPFERKIEAINGNQITIDAPIVDPIQTRYGGGAVYKTAVQGRIQNVGVENIRLVSTYESDDDENHGWIAVELSRVENCWVRDVTAQYFGYSCVSLEDQSVSNTIQDCAMIDFKSQTTGGRKYSFNINGGSLLNLFQRCFAKGGRHDFVTGSRMPGPNVFLDSYATETTSDIGPHHRWATGLLFDNIYGGQIRVQDRKESGGGHGWAGAQTLFWNCKSVKSDFKVESPKGARNWSIGSVGLVQAGNGYWESWNKNVLPRSLYITQLRERLGEAAVNNVTIPAQRNGDIYTQLSNWAGEGKFNP